MWYIGGKTLEYMLETGFNGGTNKHPEGEKEVRRW